MSKIKHHNGEVKQNENRGRRSKSALFSEIDAKSVGVSGYTLGHGAPQNNKSMQEHTLPTGVVDIDESVVLPAISSNSSNQYNSKPYTTYRSSQRHNKKPVHLPPINLQHYPDEYFYVQPNYHRHRSFHHHHPHHHPQQHHHKHAKSYDPRWWYMPINSVHMPKSYRFNEHHHHYTPPKWYELPNRQ